MSQQDGAGALPFGPRRIRLPERVGTQAMCPASVRCLPFVYGLGSFAAYVAAARKLNLSIQVVEHWQFAFDIDEPAQYFRWAQACDQVCG